MGHGEQSRSKSAEFFLASSRLEAIVTCLFTLNSFPAWCWLVKFWQLGQQEAVGSIKGGIVRHRCKLSFLSFPHPLPQQKPKPRARKLVRRLMSRKSFSHLRRCGRHYKRDRWKDRGFEREVKRDKREKCPEEVAYFLYLHTHSSLSVPSLLPRFLALARCTQITHTQKTAWQT